MGRKCTKFHQRRCPALRQQAAASQGGRAQGEFLDYLPPFSAFNARGLNWLSFVLVPDLGLLICRCHVHLCA
jgi:hypothetical protein